MPTMWEPLLERASLSGPPVEPCTKRSLTELQSCSMPGTFIATDEPADIACIAREAGPNQPRYAFTSRSRPRQREVLRAPNRDGGEVLRADPEAPYPLGATLGLQSAVTEAERRRGDGDRK